VPKNEGTKKPWRYQGVLGVDRGVKKWKNYQGKVRKHQQKGNCAAKGARGARAAHKENWDGGTGRSHASWDSRTLGRGVGDRVPEAGRVPQGGGKDRRKKKKPSG